MTRVQHMRSGEAVPLADDNVRAPGLGSQFVRGTTTGLAAFGKRFTFSPGTGPETLIDVRLDPTEPPREMTVYVDLAQTPPGVLANAPSIPWGANLEWGAGSGFVRERLPLRLRGLVRSVVAHQLRLDVVRLPGPGAPAVASAFVAFGRRGFGVLSVDTVVIPPPGPGPAIPVPDWATSVRVLANLGPAFAGMPYDWLDVTGAVIVTGAAQNWISLPAPVPRDAAAIVPLGDPAATSNVLIEWSGPIA